MPDTAAVLGHVLIMRPSKVSFLRLTDHGINQNHGLFSVQVDICKKDALERYFQLFR